MSVNWKPARDLVSLSARRNTKQDRQSQEEAVRRNCRALVELLLRYTPVSSSNDFNQYFLFRPDVKGPAGLTPLHIAAGTDGSEAVVDALTDDPGKV